MAESKPESQPSGAPADPGRGSAAPPMHSTARLVRETDLMRTAIEGDLLDVTGESLSLRTRGQFVVNESLRIHLANPVQRCEKETRGLIREIRQHADGSAVVNVKLFTRMTALQVSLFKMGILPPDADTKPRWV